MLVAATFLNPSSLGLPETVQGIPFIQSLIIIHLCIVGVLLIFLVFEISIDYSYHNRIQAEQDKYKADTEEPWKKQCETYKKWLLAVESPTVTEKGEVELRPSAAGTGTEEEPE